MRLSCPVCSSRLYPNGNDRLGIHHVCGIHGSWITVDGIHKDTRGLEFLKVLRSFSQPDRLHYIATRPCPSCHGSLVEVALPRHPHHRFALCAGCRGLWVDKVSSVETQRNSLLAAPLPSPHSGTPASPTQTLIWPSQEPDNSPFSVAPGATTNLFAYLGFPSLTGAPAAGASLAVLLLLFLMCAGTLLMHKNPYAAAAWGFFGEAPLAHSGLNWITSAFLHLGWFHFLANAYFLWTFGNTLASRIGESPIIVIFFLGHFSGMYLSMHNGLINPTYGASAGISAIITHTVFSFPNLRIGRTLLHFSPQALSTESVIKIEVPSILYLPLFFLTDLIAVLRLSASDSQFFFALGTPVWTINHWAHLGGALAGCLTALLSIMDRPDA